MYIKFTFTKIIPIVFIKQREQCNFEFDCEIILQS